MSAGIDCIEFRPTRPGFEYMPGRFNLPRHRHLRAYVTVVLSGSFEESGYVGRVRASAGDVLIHPSMDCHANQMVTDGVKLLRLSWPDEWGRAGNYRFDEIDQLARIAERDPEDAASFLAEGLAGDSIPAPGIHHDWPDLLAANLAGGTAFQLGDWAEANRLAPATVSRGFRAAFGVTPVEYRAELRARAAWLRTIRGAERLSLVAARCGFADQSHMTRWVKRVTGAPPSAWRKHNATTAASIA
ncbi:MAG: AraC family transcriptional regulator [Gemmatimonadota bacterium]